LGLVAAACGGGDDSSEATTTTTQVVAAATTTVPAPTTTQAPTTTVPTSVELVTEGATVVVANASGINGAAGRLSERLAAVGFDMAEATNSADTVSNLSTTQIYHDPSVEAALAVAESLKQALGGGAIEVLEVAVPAPTASGELGEASVLVLMGDDVADKTLDELQGVAPAPSTGDDDTGDDDTGDDDTGDDDTGDDDTTG
jgi:hypothetical protein